AYVSLRGMLTVMDVEKQSVAFQRRFAEGLQSVAFAPTESGGWLVVGDRAGHLRTLPFEQGQWDVRPTREWPAHDGRIYALRVTPPWQGTSFGGMDGRLMAWDPSTSETDLVIPLEGEFQSIVGLEKGQFAIGGIDRIILFDADAQRRRQIKWDGDWKVCFAS